jgi:formate dehydrogenase iron-sulfur subunit
VETIDRIVADENRDENLAVLDDLCELMTDGSLCAMGGLTPLPVRSALTHFPDDFTGPARSLSGARTVDIPIPRVPGARTEGTA